MKNDFEKRKYVISDCITFRKTNEEYGGLSNMAGGYLIYLNDAKILTSEALYQACRFPDFPDIQSQVLFPALFPPALASVLRPPVRKVSEKLHSVTAWSVPVSELSAHRSMHLWCGVLFL